jgi:hypothetical protein
MHETNIKVKEVDTSAVLVTQPWLYSFVKDMDELTLHQVSLYQSYWKRNCKVIENTALPYHNCAILKAT